MKRKSFGRLAFILLISLMLLPWPTQTTEANSPSSLIKINHIGDLNVGNYSAEPILLKDGKTLVVGTRNGALVFIDVSTMQVLHKQQVVDHEIRHLFEKKDGTFVLATNKDLLFTHDPASGETTPLNVKVYTSDIIPLLEKNGFLIRDNRNFYFFSFEEDKVTRHIDVGISISDWAYDPNGERLIIAKKTNDAAIATFYDVNSFSYMKTIHLPDTTSNKTTIAYDKTSDRLLMTDGQFLHFYSKDHDTPSSSRLEAYWDNSAKKIKLNENGRFALIAKSGNIKLYDTYLKDEINSWSYYNDGSFWISDDRFVILNAPTLSFYDSSDLKKRFNLASIEAYTMDDELFVDNKYNILGRMIFNDGTSQSLKMNTLNWTTADFRVAGAEKGIITARDVGNATFRASYLGHDIQLTKRIKSYIPEDADTFIDQMHDQEVAPDKTWAITVNDDVSYEYVEQKNIFVTDAKGRIVPTLYVIDRHNGSSTIQVINNAHYTPGETYTLWVRELAAEDGTPLDQKIKRTFTIASQ